jgi:hypothetical protein
MNYGCFWLIFYWLTEKLQRNTFEKERKGRVYVKIENKLPPLNQRTGDLEAGSISASTK